MMQRSYHTETRQILQQVLRNALRANKKELFSDPADLGKLSNLLREIAGQSESNTEDSETAREWYDDVSMGTPTQYMDSEVGQSLLSGVMEHFVDETPLEIRQAYEPALPVSYEAG